MYVECLAGSGAEDAGVESEFRDRQRSGKEEL